VLRHAVPRRRGRVADLSQGRAFGVPERRSRRGDPLQERGGCAQEGKGNERALSFYTHQLTERIAERLSLENKLRQALERQEFVLHYQPKVETDTRRVIGVEALIRWMSPERGLVQPLEFIPLLEETGLILEVGGRALEQAVRDHAHWLQQGIVAPRIAVNVSAIQLRRPNFVAIVEAAIKRGASPHGLDLEITESLLMEEVAANIEKLEALRELGVSVSIDDFGTGYSSLAYLAKLRCSRSRSTGPSSSRCSGNRTP